MPPDVGMVFRVQDLATVVDVDDVVAPGGWVVEVVDGGVVDGAVVNVVTLDPAVEGRPD